MGAFILLTIFFSTNIQGQGRALSVGWRIFPNTLEGKKLMENHLPLVLSGVPCGPSRLPRGTRCLVSRGRLKLSCRTELGSHPHGYFVRCFHP